MLHGCDFIGIDRNMIVFLSFPQLSFRLLIFGNPLSICYDCKHSILPKIYLVEEVLYQGLLVTINYEGGWLQRKLIASENVTQITVLQLLYLLPELLSMRVYHSKWLTCLVIRIERVIVFNPHEECLKELLFWRHWWK